MTGGASAAYGSGAVSGVVNILLDRNLDGVKLDVDYGSTGEGDGENYHFGVAGGSGFGDDRATSCSAANISSRMPFRAAHDARDWCSAGRGMFSNNPAFAFGVGAPTRRRSRGNRPTSSPRICARIK